jgi:hypothetical protein
LGVESSSDREKEGEKPRNHPLMTRVENEKERGVLTMTTMKNESDAMMIREKKNPSETRPERARACVSCNFILASLPPLIGLPSLQEVNEG